MPFFSLRLSPILTAAMLAVALAGCATTSPTPPEPAAAPARPHRRQALALPRL